MEVIFNKKMQPNVFVLLGANELFQYLLKMVHFCDVSLHHRKTKMKEFDKIVPLN